MHKAWGIAIPGLLLVGASDAAVSHAVWDLLYRLGYRQFFPGKNWEVVPQEKNLSIAVNDFEHPDYYARRIWFGYGSLPENKAPYALWCERNRATMRTVRPGSGSGPSPRAGASRPNCPSSTQRA